MGPYIFGTMRWFILSVGIAALTTLTVASGADQVPANDEYSTSVVRSSMRKLSYLTVAFSQGDTREANQDYEMDSISEVGAMIQQASEPLPREHTIVQLEKRKKGSQNDKNTGILGSALGRNNILDLDMSPDTPQDPAAAHSSPGDPMSLQRIVHKKLLDIKTRTVKKKKKEKKNKKKQNKATPLVRVKPKGHDILQVDPFRNSAL